MQPEYLVFYRISLETYHQIILAKMRKFLMTSEFLEDSDAAMNKLCDRFYCGVLAFQAMVKGRARHFRFFGQMDFIQGIEMSRDNLHSTFRIILF